MTAKMSYKRASKAKPVVVRRCLMKAKYHACVRRRDKFILKSSLRLFAQSGKARGVIDRDLGKHFTVQTDIRLLQAVDKRRIIHAVKLARRGNSRDPKSSEISFSQASADIGVLSRFPDRLFRGFKKLRFAAPVPLRKL